MDEMSPYECADLLKAILRKRSKPLISDSLLRAMILAKDLRSTESWATRHSASEHVALFINSHLSEIPEKDQQLVRGVLNVLREVIVHVEKSKMGAANVASIFALIFFGTPLTQDPLEFVQESKKRTNMLEFLLLLYTEHHDMFDPQHAQLTRLAAKRTIQRKSLSVLRGESVTVFYKSEKLSYMQVSDRVICVDDKLLRSSFVTPSAGWLDEGNKRHQWAAQGWKRNKQERDRRVVSLPRTVQEWVNVMRR